MKKFFVITKYFPISNRNVNTVVTDKNNIELNINFDSSNEKYNINNDKNRKICNSEK
jgi:hypothetical protein